MKSCLGGVGGAHLHSVQQHQQTTNNNNNTNNIIINININMSETMKDPGIMLFGRKIPLPECQILANSGAMDSCGNLKKTEPETPCAENSEQQKNNSKQNVNENDSVSKNSNPVEDDNTENSSTDEEKILKKPDKILQCPRCNSFDTKFCYFNNYNVNQPRHFCKNCQRYWTAGGTMRNVPVGAGRRKHKHLASQYRHIIVASGRVPTSRLESTDSSSCHQHISAQFNSSTDNGTVLKFGPDTPLCESMESMLNLRDQKRCVDANSMNCAENAEESSSLCGSSVTNVSTHYNESSSEQNNRTNWLKCYHVPPPWMLQWNNPYHGANNVPVNPMQWCPTPPIVPVQFVPAPYWNNNGTVSIGSSNPCLSPSSSTSNSCCTGNNNGSGSASSPTLGKHTRDNASFLADEERLEKFVLVPKAPRIDDTNEASKSPIWTKLAINIMHDKKHCVSVSDKGGEEGKESLLDVSQIMEANPAAISRAHALQESI